MNNIFFLMIFKGEKGGIILYFCKSVMSGLQGIRWILIFASIFSLFAYVAWLKHMKKGWPHIDNRVGKGSSI